MKATVQIGAGVCGFKTEGVAECEDGQNVTLAITTGCEKIGRLKAALEQLGPIDAYQEISPGAPSAILETSVASAGGCCLGCVVPAGLFKAMQVAAGLALPADSEIKVSKASEPSG